MEFYSVLQNTVFSVLFVFVKSKEVFEKQKCINQAKFLSKQIFIIATFNFFI